MDRMSKNIILCRRVEDLKEPYVKSLKRKCDSCGKDVWISLAYKDIINFLTPVCINCAVERRIE